MKNAVSITDLADHLGVSDRSIRTWIAEQGLPHAREGNRLVFDMGKVRAWVEQQIRDKNPGVRLRWEFKRPWQIARGGFEPWDDPVLVRRS